MSQHIAKTAWSREDRHQAAIQYAITGSLAKTEQATGIPNQTLSTWTKSEWWVELIGELGEEKRQEHRAMYCQLVDAAQAHTLKTIDQATPAQSMVIAGIATDKLYRADNLPSTLTGTVGSIADLAKEFNKLANERVVSVQHTTSSGDDDVD